MRKECTQGCREGVCVRGDGPTEEIPLASQARLAGCSRRCDAAERVTAAGAGSGVCVTAGQEACTGNSLAAPVARRPARSRSCTPRSACHRHAERARRRRHGTRASAALRVGVRSIPLRHSLRPGGGARPRRVAVGIRGLTFTHPWLRPYGRWLTAVSQTLHVLRNRAS